MTNPYYLIYKKTEQPGELLQTSALFCTRYGKAIIANNASAKCPGPGFESGVNWLKIDHNDVLLLKPKGLGSNFTSLEILSNEMCKKGYTESEKERVYTTRERLLNGEVTPLLPGAPDSKVYVKTKAGLKL